MALKLLPPGFRFHPTDVELILYYLKRKIMGKKLHYEAIAEVNIYKFSPWDLPDKSCMKSKDLEWFFFCPREKKYASGSRVKRATENGYWKTTGKDRSIKYNDRTVGTVKTLVFHLGHAPKGERTDWVLYEYRILDDKLAAAGMQDTYVLCKVFKKDGMGPKNGAQYGAPFNEADWADDVDAENHAMSLASDGPLLTMPMQTEVETLPIFSPGGTSGSRLVVQGPSPSPGGPTSVVADETNDNDTVCLLASFTEEDMLLSNENGINQDGLIDNIGNEPLPCSDGHDIYNGLGDLDSWGLTNEGVRDLSLLQNDVCYLNNMPFQDNSTYIELNDLLPPLDCPSGVTYDMYYLNNMPFEDDSTYIELDDLLLSLELPLPPEGFYEDDDCLDLFQMVDHQVYQGSNASSGLHFTSGQQKNLGYPTNNMERGSQKLDCYSRLMECNPAHQIPTAAEHLALTYPPIGSSIHIKAEVTHGAGECTKEALSVMMGESGSCWCYCQVFQPCFVEFRFDSICFSSEIFSPSYYYYHHHLDEDPVIMFSLKTISGNLIDSFLNIVKLQKISIHIMFNKLFVSSLS
ncbi:hypothetical protein ACS0TY_029752 [Phlomoides rotata]